MPAGGEPPRKPEPPQSPGSKVVGGLSTKPGLPNTPAEAAHPPSGTMPEGTTSSPQSLTANLPPVKRAKASSKLGLAQQAKKGVPQQLELPPSPFAEGARSPTQGVRSPSRGVQSPIQYPRSPTMGPQSPQRGVQSPTRGLQSSPGRFHSPLRGPQSPHRGVKSPTRAPQSPQKGSQSPIRAPQSPPRDPKSPQRGAQKPPRSTLNPSTLMQGLPGSPALPSSSDAVEDKDPMQSDKFPPSASKVSAPAREQSETQPALQRQTPLKRKRLVKAGEVVKKKAVEVSAAVSASTEVKSLARSAAVGGLALVPLPPKLQEKVQTEEELDEDLPYWQEPLGLRCSGQLGTASAGHFRSGPALSNAAKLLRGGHFAPSHSRATSDSPERHVPSPDSSPSQTAAADAIAKFQSGYGMSTSPPPAVPSEPNQDLLVSGQAAQHASSANQASAQRHQQQQQQQQDSLGMHAHPRRQSSESSQKAWIPPVRPELCTLQSQGSFTRPRDGTWRPPQDPRRLPTQSSLTPQDSHLQKAQGSCEQCPLDQDAHSQQPHDEHSQARCHVQGGASEHHHLMQSHVQEQPDHQEGNSRPQSQQLPGRSRHLSCHRSHSQTSQAPLETSSQAVCFVKCPLPIAAEPEKIRMRLAYKWDRGSHVQDSLDLQALCWSTDTVGKAWVAAGKPLRNHRKPSQSSQLCHHMIITS